MGVEATSRGSLVGILGRPVRVGTVRVGEVAGVVLNGSRVIGLEVEGAGSRRRFLPWFAARVGARGVEIDSALFLVDSIEAYERHGARRVRDANELARLDAV